MHEAAAKLRERRQEREETLEHMSELTKIKPECLAALEEWRLDELPSPAYTRGFIKIYCRYLELDPEPILDAYAREYEASQPKIDIFEPAKPEAIPLLPRVRLRAVLPILGGLIVSALLIFGVVRLLGALGGGGGMEREFQVLPDPYSPETLERLPLAASGEAAAGLILEIRAQDDSWVEVSADGVLKYFNTLEAGGVYQAEARDEFVLKLNSPRDISLFLNGRPVLLDESPSGAVSLTLNREMVSGE